MKRVVLLIAIILAVIGCKKPKPGVEPTINYVGDTITLKYGECKEIIDTVVNISYQLCLDTIGEGRMFLEFCEAFYGLSYAGIKIRWIRPEIDTTKLVLEVLGCRFWRDAAGGCEQEHSSIDTLGYKFCFISLEPYPDTTNYPIPLEDYTAKIKVVKL